MAEQENITIRRISETAGYDEPLSNDIVATVIENAGSVIDRAPGSSHGTDCLMILTILKGSISISIDYKDYRIRGNSMIILMPEHRLRYYGCDEGTRILCVATSLNFLHNCSLNNVNEPKPEMSRYIFIKNNPVHRLTQQDLGKIRTGYIRIRKSLKKDRSGYFFNDFVRNALYYFLLEVSDIIHSQNDIKWMPAGGREKIFETFLELANRKIAEKHNVAYYSTRLCISEQYLNSILRKLSGKSAKQWLNELLVLECKKRLLSKNYSIQQISDMLHFPNQSNFCRFFKKMCGFTPSEYMNTYTESRVFLSTSEKKGRETPQIP